MSSIAVTASASGAGVITLQAPVTPTSRTITLPDATGTLLSTATPGVPIGGPAFSAQIATSQSITTGVSTKVAFNSKVFDTNTNYDAALFRFTPSVAGYYFINASVLFGSMAGVQSISIYKNGVRYLSGDVTTATGSNNVRNSSLIYCSGAADYIEIYAYQNSGSSISLIGTSTATGICEFSATMVRSAT